MVARAPGVTITVAIPLTVPLLPFLAIMVVVPTLFAVNTPVAELIVPTVVLLLLQNAAGLIVIGLLFWSRPDAVKV